MDRTGEGAASRGPWLEVFAVFLRLGLTSFGGPIAHLGYFRDAGFTGVGLHDFIPGALSRVTGTKAK